MSNITRWNPFREMVDMQRQLDRVFDEMNRGIGNSEWTQGGNWLALDVHENEDGYIVETDLPGINIDDINITLHENTLTISAEINREETQDSDRRLLSERRYGRFQRSIRLGNTIDADNVDATYENGVLTLMLPKSEASKPRQIAINGNTVNPQLTNQN